MKKYILLLLLIPSISFGAFISEDNFDSYSAGSASGLSGGTGWTSNWGSSFSCGNITTSTFDSSPNSFKCDTGQINRDFSTVTVGTFYYSFNSSGSDTYTIFLRKGANNVVV